MAQHQTQERGSGETAIMVKSEPLLKQEMRTRGSLDPASLPPDMVKRTEVVWGRREGGRGRVHLETTSLPFGHKVSLPERLPGVPGNHNQRPSASPTHKLWQAQSLQSVSHGTLLCECTLRHNPRVLWWKATLSRWYSFYFALSLRSHVTFGM